MSFYVPSQFDNRQDSLRAEFTLKITSSSLQIPRMQLQGSQAHWGKKKILTLLIIISIKIFSLTLHISLSNETLKKKPKCQDYIQ